MVVPAAFDYVNHDPAWEAFAESSALTLLFGGLFVLANRPSEQMELSIRETFLLTSASWMILAVFSALPFILTTVTASHTDSIFEAISGLTTTGATVIVGLDYAPAGLLIWRALLQWLGGIGIIVMAMTVLPVLSIGGMQLFRSEFSDRSEKIMPRVSQITKAIFFIYCGLTTTCALLLWGAGMGIFDAICHSFATVSTGGFSNYDASVAHFDSALIEGIMSIFMILGAMTILLIFRFFNGDYTIFWSDDQTRTLLLVLFNVIMAVSVWLWWTEGWDFMTALRHVSFNYISIMSSSGFASMDYGQWGVFPAILFMALMFIGGCTGSTAGGFKIMRLRVVYELTKNQLYKLYRPHIVRVPTYNKQELTLGLFTSVVTFLTLFFITYGILVTGLAMTGLDLETCISSAAACLSNIGPGLGEIVGPAGNYASLPDAAKWILMAGMILGRLELVTVIVLFRPSFWRK